jgi:hypothetical protein
MDNVNKEYVQNEFEICKEKLKSLVNKKELYFTKRCNKSIELSVSLAIRNIRGVSEEVSNVSNISKKEVFLLIQEEGGWITYKNYAKKHKLNLVKLEMKNGKIMLEQLANGNYGDAILLIHSLPGYSYVEDMDKLKDAIQKAKQKGNNMILINDCCGSIGTTNATIGDIIVCSFGEAKPLSAGGGGFIATNNFLNFNSKSNNSLNEVSDAEKDAIEIIDFHRLNLSIDSLQEKLFRWRKMAKSVKKELIKKGLNILNSNDGEEEGINVLVGFNDDSEKERLINYCEENHIEYTECPRYIRTNKKAISIEIKRLNL